MYTYKIKDYITYHENINVLKHTADSCENAHIHEFIELVYIFSGMGIHSINNISYEVKKGDLLFINYNQVHSFSTEKQLTYVNFLMKPEFMSSELFDSDSIFEIFTISLFEEFEGVIDKTKPIVSFTGKELIEIETIIENMLKEFDQKQIGYKSIISGYMRVLFSKLIRKLSNISSQTVETYTNCITPEVMEYINNNCFGKISLKDVAKKYFYNPSYFSRVFKRYNGKNLTEYIQERRVKESLYYLAETNYTVNKIIEMVGYSDKKQFYKLFRDYIGSTPNEFRRNRSKERIEK